MRLLAILLLLTGVVCTGVPARAEGDTAQTLVPDELGEVALLKARGGHLAVHRLRALLRRGAPEVRVAALGALTHVGLRSEAAVESVRRAMGTLDVGERQAALRALGRIGDSRDLEAFLGALREDDSEVRTTALQGLRALTGRRLPVSPTRCSLWWRSSARGLRQGVHTALEAVADAVTDRRVEAALETLARDGWVDLEAVTESAQAWLRSSDHELRAAGFHLAATLRLADLASAVESALPFVTEADAREGLAAARALGLPPDLLPPFWLRRLRAQDPAATAR